MKKIIIVLILLFSTSNAYAFWPFSSQKKPAAVPVAKTEVTDFKADFDKIYVYYQKGDYNRALKGFRVFVKKHPRADRMADVQYYIGRCLEGMKLPYLAFKEYQKVVDKYPNSQKITEIIERQYKIGEDLFNKTTSGWMGSKKYDFVDHPSIDIFKTIVEKSPYSSYAPLAQYKLGMLYMELSKYTEAKEAFQKLIDSYPESEWYVPAKYQLAMAVSKGFNGSDYDTSSVDEASKHLNEFVTKHGDSQAAPMAQDKLTYFKDQESQKNYDTAKFYDSMNKFSSARLYYKIVVSDYPDTKYADLASKRLEEIKDK